MTFNSSAFFVDTRITKTSLRSSQNQYNLQNITFFPLSSSKFKGETSDEFLASDERCATQRQLKCKEKADVKSRLVPCQHGSVTFLGFALDVRRVSQA